MQLAQVQLKTSKCDQGWEKLEDRFYRIQFPTISLHTIAQPPLTLQVVIENSQGVGMNRDREK